MPNRVYAKALGEVEIYQGFNQQRVCGQFLLYKPFTRSAKVKLFKDGLRCKGFITVVDHFDKLTRIMVPDENVGYRFTKNPKEYYFDIWNIYENGFMECLKNRDERKFKQMYCANHDKLSPGSPNPILFSFGPYEKM